MVGAEEPWDAEELFEGDYDIELAGVGLFALLAHIFIASEGVENFVCLLVIGDLLS